MARRADPEAAAKRVLTKYNITGCPVDVLHIAAQENLAVKEVDLPDDISGVLEVQQGRSRIFLNRHHAEKRRRFSCAHELGHYFMHRIVGVHVDKQTFNRDKGSQSGLFPEEIEANAFAAALLMPKDLIEAKIEEFKAKNGTLDLIDTDEEFISEFARDFNVSVTAMAFRLSKLGYTL